MRHSFLKQLPLIAIVALLIVNVVTLHLSASNVATTRNQSPKNLQTAIHEKAQYKVVRIDAGFLLGFSNTDLQRIISQNASQGWEFVQVLEAHNLIVFKKIN